MTPRVTDEGFQGPPDVVVVPGSHRSKITRVGAFKLWRRRDGSRQLTLTRPGYLHRIPRFRGWKPFFVAHHAHEKTVVSYKERSTDGS